MCRPFPRKIGPCKCCIRSGNLHNLRPKARGHQTPARRVARRRLRCAPRPGRCWMLLVMMRVQTGRPVVLQGLQRGLGSVQRWPWVCALRGLRCVPKPAPRPGALRCALAVRGVVVAEPLRNVQLCRLGAWRLAVWFVVRAVWRRGPFAPAVAQRLVQVRPRSAYGR